MGWGEIIFPATTNTFCDSIKSVVVVLQDKWERAKFSEEYVLLVSQSKKNLFKGGWWKNELCNYQEHKIQKRKSKGNI